MNFCVIDFDALLASSKAQLVSSSNHAEVFKLVGDKLTYSLKIINPSKSRLLEHQQVFLKRLSERFSQEQFDPDEVFDIPPVLYFGDNTHPFDKNSEEVLCILTPWIAGTSLAHILYESYVDSTFFRYHTALTLLQSLALNLAGLQNFGSQHWMVHQDINPRNIIVHDKSQGKFTTLIDFDTSFFSDDYINTIPYGTYGYTPPERILFDSFTPSPLMDIFSFGIIAHEILSGMWPYRTARTNMDSTFWRELYLNTAFHFNANIPKDILELIRCCVELQPENRPSHSQLLDALSALIDVYHDDVSFSIASYHKEGFVTPI